MGSRITKNKQMKNGKNVHKTKSLYLDASDNCGRLCSEDVQEAKRRFEDCLLEVRQWVLLVLRGLRCDLENYEGLEQRTRSEGLMV